MKIRCKNCDGTGLIEAVYAYASVFQNLLEQTPKVVWDEYRDNGYTIHQAVASELSCGEDRGKEIT